SNLGIMPNVNNKPPILNASNTSPIVNNILSIPPRVSNASISSTPVADTYPLNNVSNKSPIGFAPLMKDMAIALTDPAASANNAGSFIKEKINKTATGITPRYQWTRPVFNNPCLKDSILPKSVVVIFGDNIPYKMSAITNAGTVVHVILRMCVNKSTSKIDDAIFVVSDKGDILSPKNAPDTIAPTVIACDTSSASEIPTNAKPTVPTVVKELPTQRPIIDVTTKTT